MCWIRSHSWFPECAFLSSSPVPMIVGSELEIQLCPCLNECALSFLLVLLQILMPRVCWKYSIKPTNCLNALHTNTEMLRSSRPRSLVLGQSGEYMRRHANHCVDDYCLCCRLLGQAVHIARPSHDPFRL